MAGLRRKKVGDSQEFLILPNHFGKLVLAFAPRGVVADLFRGCHEDGFVIVSLFVRRALPEKDQAGLNACTVVRKRAQWQAHYGQELKMLQEEIANILEG